LYILAEKNRHLPASTCNGNSLHICDYKTCCRREAASPVDGVERRATAPIAQTSMCKSISGSESFTLQITKDRAENEKELTCRNKQE